MDFGKAANDGGSLIALAIHLVDWTIKKPAIIAGFFCFPRETMPSLLSAWYRLSVCPVNHRRDSMHEFMMPTRREYDAMVWAKAKQQEGGVWWASVGMGVISLLAIVIWGVLVGDWNSILSNTFTIAAGCFLFWIISRWYYLKDARYQLHCEQFAALHELRNKLDESDRTKDVPTTIVCVKRIMETFAYYGHEAISAGDEQFYIEWNTEVEAFMRAALVDSWNHALIKMTPANARSVVLHSGEPGSREPGSRVALQICDRAQWLEHCASLIGESDINHGSTERQLAKWINWKPSRPLQKKV